MKRWLVTLLIALAVAVLVAPGIVGRLAQKRVEETLDFASAGSDELIIRTESFERRWFTSEGRHRIELREGVLSAELEGYLAASGGVPSLIIDTHVDHGPVPLTSMSRDTGSLRPGLASTASTLKLDRGDGEPIDIPGRIVSHVGLGGQTTSRFLLEGGSARIGDAVLEWQGADVTVRSNPAQSSVAVQGSVQPWSIVHVGGSARVGPISIEGQETESDYGFGLGDIRLKVGQATFEPRGGPKLAFDAVSIDAASKIDGERINGQSMLQIDGLSTPDFGVIDVAIQLAANRLEPESLQNIVAALQSASRRADPEPPFALLYPAIEADLQALLLAGAEIRLERFDVRLPEGTLSTTFRLDLPKAEPAEAFSWPARLLALSASADLRLPVLLFDRLKTVSPEAGAAVAMGYLRKDGEYYALRAEYAKGLLTVNGAPLPIPLSVE